jgi:hypoxanthine phosphoribosyltransferase
MKLYFTYNQIHETVRRMAERIRASGFEPDVMVAIGSGGFIPARILKTYLDVPILTVGISYYGIDNVPTEKPQTIQWIDEVEAKLAGKRLLLVDEVDDTRVTLEYTLHELNRHRPREIAVMVLHDKKKPKRGAFPPWVRHVFAGEALEDLWIVYPWDATDITEHDRLAAGAPVPAR